MTAGPASANATVDTNPATGIGDTTATLHGTLLDMDGYALIVVGFLYTVNASMAGPANVTPSSVAGGGQLTAPGSFNATISGLTPGTVYYFQAWAWPSTLWTKPAGWPLGGVLNFTTTDTQGDAARAIASGLPGYVALAILFIFLALAVVVTIPMAGSYRRRPRDREGRP